MNPIKLLLSLLAFVLCTMLAFSSQEKGPTNPPKKATEAQIGQWIEELGNAKFKIRMDASRQLKEIDDALPALRNALKTGDLERRRRVEEIIGVIELRLVERFITEAVAQVNDEGLDLFIDRMVLKKEYATEARWKAAINLANGLAKRAAQAGATAPTWVEQDFLKLPVSTSVQGAILNSGRVLVTGVEEKVINVQNCLFMSSGSLKQTNSVDGSILFVNGDFEGLNSTTNSVIFCNGRVKSFNSTRNCIIYCNGVVESMNSSQGNAIFVRGELRRLNYTKNNVIEATEFGQGNFSEGNTYVNRRVLPGRGQNDRLLQMDPAPVNLIQFFDPARIGLAFTMVDGDARVDSVADGKPFAKTGLAKGDLILALDKAKFISRETFVTLLRRKVALGQTSLKVQRGDRVLNVPVEFER
jgi:hypothetical protein